jgi:HSP20 family protein
MMRSRSGRSGRSRRESGRDPTVAEVAARTGMSPDKILLAVQSAVPIASLDAPVTEDHALGSLLPDASTPSPEHALDRDAPRLAARALQSLSDRHRLVLELRFGIGHDRPHTLDEIGRRLGVTRERVRQLEIQALTSLRRRAARLSTARAAEQRAVKKGGDVIMLANREEPFGFLRRFASELDRVFEEPWTAFAPRWETLEPRAWAPTLELFEKDNRLVARFDVPGMKKEDVHVEVRDGHLVVHGERKHEQKEQKEGFYRTEREYGSFYRTVPLPEGVGIDDVKATIGEGVLEVTMPLPVKKTAAVQKVEVADAKAAAAKAA